MSNTYNGWSNYETWNCNLWLDNDNYFNSVCNQKALDLANDVVTKDESIYILSNFIKEILDENMPENKPSVYSDLLQSAISNINFYEIAEHFIKSARNDLAIHLWQNKEFRNKKNKEFRNKNI